MSSLRIRPTSVYIGQNVTMDCDVTDRGNPRVSWFYVYKDGTILSRPHQIDQSVDITVTRVSQEGTYTCKAGYYMSDYSSNMSRGSHLEVKGR